MHMFSRVATLGGGPARPVDWATRITERVNAVGSVNTSLWSAAFGYPGGTVAWSTLVESRAQLADEFAKIGADSQFLALAEEGAEFATTPFQDTLRSIVHMTTEPTGDGPPLGAVADIITARAAAGQFGAATAWGVQIADQYATISGTGAVFAVDDYGPFGQVTWIGIHADAAAADAAAAALAADTSYAAAVEGAAGLFEPGSGQRGSLVRIA
jgi:hypothetical protein